MGIGTAGLLLSGLFASSLVQWLLPAPERSATRIFKRFDPNGEPAATLEVDFPGIPGFSPTKVVQNGL